MSKKRKKIDTNQAALDFDAPIQQYEELRVKLLNAPETQGRIDSFEEACIEVAAMAKSDHRASGMSREEMVDAINDYFGATDSEWRLSIHMFNHYLSKPTQYPMPAALIYAIQHITGSLAIISNFAKAEDARVISGEEVRKLAIGKLDDAIAEMQRLKKEFRGIKR
ncbi:MAG TPA: hypothetical protein P5244_14750 [Syntrophales bacterium]|nr:hypothetical protein [Syntrophales bacterium]